MTANESSSAMTAAPTTPPSPMTPNAAVIGSSALLEHKTCWHCKDSKPISDFAKNPRSKDGKDYICKPCRRDYTRAWQAAKYHSDPETAKAKNRQRYKEDPTTWNKLSAKWQKANMQKHAQINKAWRTRNPEKWEQMKARTALSKRIPVPTSIWPEPLVSLKVKLAKLKRYAKGK